MPMGLKSNGQLGLELPEIQSFVTGNLLNLSNKNQEIVNVGFLKSTFFLGMPPSLNSLGEGSGATQYKVLAAPLHARKVRLKIECVNSKHPYFLNN